MPDQDTQAPIELAFEIASNDLLSVLWASRSRARNHTLLVSAAQPPPTRAQRLKRSLKPFAFGCCLGAFHLNAIAWVIYAAYVARGHPIAVPAHAALLSTGTILFGIIWLLLLTKPAIAKARFQAALKRQWRTNLPEILQAPLPVRLSLLTDKVVFEILGGRTITPLGPAVELIEQDAHIVLNLRGTPCPIPKHTLLPDATRAIRVWATAHSRLFVPVPQRHILLPPRLSAWTGAAICLCCILIAGNVTALPNPATNQSRAVMLALPNATTIIGGEVAHLNGLTYTASVFNGVLYDQLSGYIDRPEISGTFHMDRSAAPYLAQTAQDEFAEERTWNMTVGKIPATARRYDLDAAGVYIAWDNAPGADYPGHCGALRANRDTLPAPDGRVFWRGRLYLQLCSASMSADDLKAWMLHAIAPVYRQIVSRAQATP